MAKELETEIVCYLIAGAIIGVKLAFDGFKKWKYKRYIQDIPVSKIGSAAMGLVKLEGQAEGIGQTIRAPLTGEECVFYTYKVEKYRYGGAGDSHWEVVSEGKSDNIYFCIKDSTGQVLCAPQGVELLNKPTFYFANKMLNREIPERLKAFLIKSNIEYKQIINNGHFRFYEWVIRPNDYVCILGSLDKIKGTIEDISDFKATLNKRLKTIKNDPETMMTIDTDRDGKISQEEWEAKVKEIKEEIAARAQDIPALQNRIAIKKGEDEQIFIISQKKREALFSGLQWQAWGLIFGGSAGSIICIYLLSYIFKNIFVLNPISIVAIIGLIIILIYSVKRRDKSM
ncbi:MAG: hypothetical protein PHD29_06445 [bacterium]|nr:hypothetical protein [bacterium]